MSVDADSAENRGGAMCSALLLGDKPSRDIALVAKAIKKQWPIKPSSAKALVQRLLDITEKTSVTVINKQGEAEEVDGPADVNAIAAARVIVAMTGQNIAATKSGDTKKQTVINVGVSVDVDARRDRIREIAERVRTGRVSGLDTE